MKNKQEDIREIEAIVKRAGIHIAPATTAQESARVIDELFVVIHRDDLPEVKVEFYGRIEIDGYNHSENGNVDTLMSNARRYLAAAAHVQKVQAEQEAKRVKEAASKLEDERYAIYKELFEDLAHNKEEFIWGNLRKSTRNSVETVRELRSQLATSK